MNDYITIEVSLHREHVKDMFEHVPYWVGWEFVDRNTTNVRCADENVDRLTDVLDAKSIEWRLV